MNNVYDVVVIGGGPAGGQCARELSQKGIKVLLVERYKSFEDNNFSSAGMTLEPLKEFDLPDSVIGSYWKNFIIQCTQDEYRWESNENKGVVLDFGRLRQFLADECVKFGGEVLMGCKYLKKQVYKDKVEAVFLNTETKDEFKVQAKLLVDATGPSRKVIYDQISEYPELVNASGLEYLIEVSEQEYNKYKEKLIFFLGEKWAHKGYSWIFPMENQILKVGSGKIHMEVENEEKYKKINKTLIEKLLAEYMQLKESDYKIIDIHGGTLKYSPSIKDTFYQNRVLAIGDAISAVNPLGGEGIRYAMRSGSMAMPFIEEFVKTGKNTFDKYRKKWKKQHLLKWQVCELYSKRVYGKYTDKHIEDRIKYYHQVTQLDGVVDSLFNFKFRKLFLRILMVYHLKLKDKLGLLKDERRKFKLK